MNDDFVVVCLLGIYIRRSPKQFWIPLAALTASLWALLQGNNVRVEDPIRATNQCQTTEKIGMVSHEMSCVCKTTKLDILTKKIFIVSNL